MRNSGLQVRLSGEGVAQAKCRIDAAALERHFKLAGVAIYQDLVAYDRSVEAPPQARIQCSTCNSRIRVEHPVVVPDAQVFPHE
jgi:hypothetical protein